MYMYVAGAGEGPLVLLCHGFLETSYSWRHQLIALARAGFHAVAPDLRGYGATDNPREIDQYTIINLVGDIISLLDMLRVEKAVIVGHDWGATLAWHAALLRPDRFYGVVGLSVPMMAQLPSFFKPTNSFPQTDESLYYALYFQEEGPAETEFARDRRATMKKILVGASGNAAELGAAEPFGMVSRKQGMLDPLPLPETLPDWLTENDVRIYSESFRHSGFRGALNWYRNLDRNQELLVFARGLTITIPALYMVGERDVVLASLSMQYAIDHMSELVPKLTQIIELPGCGHWTQQERPNEVNAAIIAFANKLLGKE
jgi:pimeloyl-ACP methyl ester carboxylesterase